MTIQLTLNSMNWLRWNIVQDYPCTKLVVPSMGSTIHVGSSVSSIIPQAVAVSSPMNWYDQDFREWKGKRNEKERKLLGEKSNCKFCGLGFKLVETQGRVKMRTRTNLMWGVKLLEMTEYDILACLVSFRYQIYLHFATKVEGFKKESVTNKMCDFLLIFV